MSWSGTGTSWWVEREEDEKYPIYKEDEEEIVYLLLSLFNLDSKKYTYTNGTLYKQAMGKEVGELLD